MAPSSQYAVDQTVRVVADEREAVEGADEGGELGAGDPVADGTADGTSEG